MTDNSWLGPAIDVRPLLAEQQAAFIDLLRRLDTGEWAQPTICPGWNVKDVAAHVLGDHVGRLSIHRDAETWEIRARAGLAQETKVDHGARRMTFRDYAERWRLSRQIQT